VLEETIQLYRQQLKQRRSVVEDAFGRRGGLKRPTVDLQEFQYIAKTVEETLSNALAQMRECCSPRLPRMCH
jgi:hypothetical protein